MTKLEQIEALRDEWKAKLSRHKKSGNIAGWNSVADVVNCLNLALRILNEPSNTQIHTGGLKPRCSKCPIGVTKLINIDEGKKFCQFCGRDLSR